MNMDPLEERGWTKLRLLPTAQQQMILSLNELSRQYYDSSAVTPAPLPATRIGLR